MCILPNILAAFLSTLREFIHTAGIVEPDLSTLTAKKNELTKTHKISW